MMVRIKRALGCRKPDGGDLELVIVRLSIGSSSSEPSTHRIPRIGQAVASNILAWEMQERLSPAPKTSVWVWPRVERPQHLVRLAVETTSAAGTGVRVFSRSSPLRPSNHAQETFRDRITGMTGSSRVSCPIEEMDCLRSEERLLGGHSANASWKSAAFRNFFLSPS